MRAKLAESHVEEAALAWLEELGYATANGLDIGPDGNAPERANYGDVLLIERVRAAIAKLNPNLTAETRAEVLAKLTLQPKRLRWWRKTAGCIATWSKACRSRSRRLTAPSAANKCG